MHTTEPPVTPLLDHDSQSAETLTSPSPLRYAQQDFAQFSQAELTLPESSHPHFGWAVLWCLAFLLLTQVVAAVVGVLLFFVTEAALVGFNLSAFLDNLTILDQAYIFRRVFALVLPLMHVFSLGLSLVLLRTVVGRDWARQIGLLRRPSWTQIGLVVLLLPGFALAGTAVQDWAKALCPSLMGKIGLDVENVIRQMKSLPFSFLMLTIAVGPALGEELWCRAFLGRGLVKSHGTFMGVLLASLLFGLIHVDPPQATAAAVMGIALHVSYLLTRSLWTPILLHFLNNGLAVILLTREESVASLEQPTGWVVGLGFGLLFAGFYALYCCRTREVRDEANPNEESTRFETLRLGWAPLLLTLSTFSTLVYVTWLSMK